MEDYITNIVVFGVASWTSAFMMARKTFQGRSFDFHNRIISIVHATLALILGVQTIQDWSCPICPLPSPANSKQMKTLAVSLSYLMYDLICIMFDKRINFETVIHHSVGIVGIWAALRYKMCLSESVVVLCLGEISTPLLHMREIVKELGYKDTQFNLTLDIAFAVVFTLARMVIGPFISYAMISSPNPFLLQAMAMGLQLISVFWFYKIVRMVRFKLAKRHISPKHSGLTLKTTKKMKF